MAGAQWLLELGLVLLLGATLFHAMRLERALGVLKQDRATLEELVAGFNESTRQAEAGIERLRTASEGAGRQIARQIEEARLLRDDLAFVADRGESLAQRLEEAVRSARSRQDLAPSPSPLPLPLPPAGIHAPASAAPIGTHESFSAAAAEPPRVRSQAERDLLRALRLSH